VIGLLQQGLSGSQNIQKLFGVLGSAHGPKPRTNASGHNNGIMVLTHNWQQK
jgi:hypothetical protein